MQTFFNRSKTYAIAGEARENERTTLMDIDIKRDTIAFQTALDAYLRRRTVDTGERHRITPSRPIYEQISQTVAEQTAEGRKARY